MKKLLLTLAAVIGFGFGASAQTTIEAENLATAIGGAKNLSGYTIDIEKNNGTTAPSLHANTGAIRLYAKGTVQVKGDKLTKIVFTLASDAYFRYTEFKPSVGTLNPAQTTATKETHDTSITWEGDATDVTFTVGDKSTLGTDGADTAGQIRFTSITIYGEGGAPVDPVDPDPVFTKVNTLETGVYAVLVGNQIAVAQKGGTYGRWNLSDITVNNNTVSTKKANTFTITVENGKATIKDADNRYMGMDNSHFTSFQYYTELNDGCYWTYAFNADGNVTFTNTLNTECIICQSKGNQGTFYTNVAPAKAPQEYNLPTLYKEGQGAGVEAVEAETADAPVVYYNLQGVRVENPENGLYIRVQGNKATKVAIR